MINYDSIEIIPGYARHFRYKNAITKHYDNIKDLNVIIKFHWYDEWKFINIIQKIFINVRVAVYQFLIQIVGIVIGGITMKK